MPSGVDHTHWNATAERTFVRQVFHLVQTDSTNDEARRRLASGEGSPPFLVVADRQTLGRGRRGNRWWTGEGSLAMTLCLGGRSVGCLAKETPLLSLVTALSVAEAASHILVHREATVHWPNDVYVGERKLAGILIETAPNAYLVGVGVNADNEAFAAPPETAARLTTLRDLCGRRIDAAATAIDILNRLDENLRLTKESPESLLAEINRRCGQRGRTMTVQAGNTRIVGSFVEISLDGELVLATNGGRRPIASGTVTSFRG